MRLWADNIYARVMASHETHTSKEAILSLGRAIAANRTNSPESSLLKILPTAVGLDWKLRQDRSGYFRRMHISYGDHSLSGKVNFAYEMEIPLFFDECFKQ